MSQCNEMKMNLLYGVNQADACEAFAIGESSECIQQRLRDIGTRMIRLFLYDKGAPDPVTQWPIFESYVKAVLNVGAKPTELILNRVGMSPPRCRRRCRWRRGSR